MEQNVKILTQGKSKKLLSHKIKHGKKKIEKTCTCIMSMKICTTNWGEGVGVGKGIRN
jgi:hypothetical protein